MGQLRDRMEADFKIGGYSVNTRRIYLLYARKFATYFRRSPVAMGADEIRRYMLHLVEERKASPETMRQVRAALRFLYTVTLNRPFEVAWVPVPRRHRRVPIILSDTEVDALLDAIRASKYRAILMTMNAGGLRISEACRMRPEEIDSKRMVVCGRGKGSTERHTVLSKRLLHELRSYWRSCRPQEP